jgi:hypothetical protein
MAIGALGFEHLPHILRNRAPAQQLTFSGSAAHIAPRMH